MHHQDRSLFPKITEKKKKKTTLCSLSSQVQILNTDYWLLNVKLRNVFKCLDRPIFIWVTVAEIIPYYSQIQEGIVHNYLYFSVKID